MTWWSMGRRCGSPMPSRLIFIRTPYFQVGSFTPCLSGWFIHNRFQIIINPITFCMFLKILSKLSTRLTGCVFLQTPEKEIVSSLDFVSFRFRCCHIPWFSHILIPAHRNKSLICLPMDTPGIHLAKKIDKMGMKVMIIDDGDGDGDCWWRWRKILIIISCLHSVFRHCCHLLWRRTCSGEEHHWRGGWVAIMIYLKIVVELEAWPINYVFLSLYSVSKNNFSHRQVWASHTRWCNSRRKGKTKTHKEKQKIFFKNLRIPIKAGSISHQPHADGEHNQRHHRLHQVLCQHQHHQCTVVLHLIIIVKISMFVAIVKKHLIRERKAFGAPLLDNQYIHFRLAELLTEVEMLR